MQKRRHVELRGRTGAAAVSCPAPPPEHARADSARGLRHKAATLCDFKRALYTSELNAAANSIGRVDIFFMAKNLRAQFGMGSWGDLLQNADRHQNSPPMQDSCKRQCAR